jgi:hypothetical protein
LTTEDFAAGLSGVLGVLMIVQTLAWLAALMGGAQPEPDYLVRLLDDLTADILRNRQGLELRNRALVFAVAAPIVLTIAFGLLAI